LTFLTVIKAFGILIIVIFIIVGIFYVINKMRKS
jgi:hypothetical protein